MDSTQLAGIFVTGLLAGGLSCMAVQGGLLAATIAQRSTDARSLVDGKESRFKKLVGGGNAKPIVAFLTAKLIAYTALGFLLGWLGSTLQFSSAVQIILQAAVGIFMLGTALHLLKVHPVFRYFVIQPPHFLAKIIRRETRSKSVFAPAVLGAFTVFIPCGTTQAMMALSVASGNAVMGAVILFAFVLGTSPVFFLLGYFASKVTNAAQSVFTKFAAVVLLSLALFNLNNTLALTGSTFTLESFARGGWCLISFCEDTVSVPAAVSDASITIDGTGYTPRQLSVKAGADVSLHLTNKDSTNCAQAFTIPSLGVRQIVPVGQSQIVHFRAPEQPVQLSFMCSMGMYRGTINVI